jgi:hypothetical protein
LEFANRSVKNLRFNRNFDKNKPPVTHATSNLGIWLNGKIGLYLEDLANPKDNADLVPNCL